MNNTARYGFVPLSAILLLATHFASAVAGQPGAAQPSQAGSAMPLLEPHGHADLEKLDERIYLVVEKLARHLRSQVHPWREDPKLLLLTESRSGEHHIRPNTGAIEGALRVRGAQPLHVRYVGASKPSQSRVTDLLYLNYLGEEHRWRAGETISSYEVTVDVQR